MGTNSKAETTAAFAIPNLQANYPRPFWFLEQQY
jgi:hypothetical protein